MKGEFTLQEGISREAKDLLKSLLEINPAKRITIPGILAHPWIVDAKDSVELFTQAEKNFMISQIQKTAEEPQNFDADDID